MGPEEQQQDADQYTPEEYDKLITTEVLLSKGNVLSRLSVEKEMLQVIQWEWPMITQFLIHGSICTIQRWAYGRVCSTQ